MNKLIPLFDCSMKNISLAHLKCLGFTSLLLFSSLSPANADLSVSYSVGDMFVASYELPAVEVNTNSVRLASIEEYGSVNADVPEFYGAINVVDRAPAARELFLSARTAVSDPIFELLFVDAINGEVVDWFRLDASSSAVRIQDLRYQNGLGGANLATDSRSSLPYNEGNREVVTLLTEVSRQLSEARASTGRSDAAVIPNPTVASPPELLTTETVDEPIVVFDDPRVPQVDYSSVANMPVDFAVISEVHLATANMKNFLLTLVVTALSLIVAIGIILYKTKRYVSASAQANTQNVQNQNSMLDATSMASGFLSHLKEESLRSQEIYLKSMELLVSNNSVLHEQRQSSMQSVVPPQSAASSNIPVNQISETRQQEQENSPTNELAERSRKQLRRQPFAAPQQVTSGAPKGMDESSNRKPMKDKNDDLPIRSQVKEQLDLAEVYKNMGDIFMAQSLLQEVIKTGNASEVSQAQQALKNIGEI